MKFTEDCVQTLVHRCIVACTEACVQVYSILYRSVCTGGRWSVERHMYRCIMEYTKAYVQVHSGLYRCLCIGVFWSVQRIL